MEQHKTISSNLTALRRVMEEIFALLELVLDGTALRLPRILHVAANRLLVPAESALRRLIVIAAREVDVRLPPPRPMPTGKVIITKGIGPLSFQLYDTRKRFDRSPAQAKLVQPRIHFFDRAPIIPLSPPKHPTSSRICRRFAAFKHALENIPHQAKRMALWQLKRAKMEQTKFRSPLRPGAPPGSRRNGHYDIDHILQACQVLAYVAAREAPS